MRYGAGAVGSGLDVTMRTGPYEPMCSQMLAEPGPPLYKKVTGRFDDSPSAV